MRKRKPRAKFAVAFIKSIPKKESPFHHYELGVLFSTALDEKSALGDVMYHLTQGNFRDFTIADIKAILIP